MTAASTCGSSASSMARISFQAEDVQRFLPAPLGFHARRFREAQLAFRQRFIKEVLDFRLFPILGHRQLADQQVTGAFQHFLFPETEWLALSEEKEAFQDYGNVEEGTGSHLVRIFLEPVFPVGVVLAFA